MASVDDLEELIATRKLNGVNDNLYKEDSNIEDVEKLKSLLYKGRLTQYGKRMLIKYYENEIQRQKEIIEDYQRMYCRAINENIPKQKIKDKIEELKNKLKFIACSKDCNKCFDKNGKALYRGSNFLPCYAYHQIKILQELLQKSEDK